MAAKIIVTGKGKIAGVEKKGYTVYKGIRYAKPPIGELRFRAPQETDSWEGVYQADKFSTICYQMEQQEGSFYTKEFFSDPSYMTPMSEDSLFLNIWVPEHAQGEALPVAFWIHGGAFFNGYGHEMEFDGEAFCRKGVILVTINYRLGAFGFLAHPWLTAESRNGSSGNYGILDQIAALNWVHEYIPAFGGDPSKITIFGQSAGSISAQVLVSSKLTAGKIKGAILQSGGGYNSGLGRDKTLVEAEQLGEEFAKLCDVKSLEELRALPTEIIMNKAQELFVNSMKLGTEGLPFTPVVDGYVLTKGYTGIVDAGLHQDIPYMIGSTKNDIGVTEEMLKKGIKSQLYQGCINWSLKLVEQGRQPAYVYYFTRQLKGDEAGAFHSSELWYEFATLGRSWRPKEEADDRLSEDMVTYWTNFVKTGNPNEPGLGEWKPCTKADPFVKEFY